MKMDKKKIVKTFRLFGNNIPYVVEVDDDHPIEMNNAPALTNQEEENFSGPAVISPELPPAGACLLFKKRLETSDVDPVQSRLLIPSCKEILEVLTDIERHMVENEKKGLKVKVMDSRRCCFDMDLKWWPSLKKLVMNKGWMKLVKANQLKKGDVVGMRYYRRDSSWCFTVDICERSTSSSTR